MQVYLLFLQTSKFRFLGFLWKTRISIELQKNKAPCTYQEAPTLWMIWISEKSGTQVWLIDQCERDNSFIQITHHVFHKLNNLIIVVKIKLNHCVYIQKREWHMDMRPHASGKSILLDDFYTQQHLQLRQNARGWN